MTKEEKARNHARRAKSLCMDSSDEEDIYEEDLIIAYLAGSNSTQQEARERAVKTLNTILGKISIDVMKEQFKLGCDYREEFLKLYDND